MQPDQPPCHCPEPTPWDDRRDDGVWTLDPDEPMHQRTCLDCGASLCRQVQP